MRKLTTFVFESPLKEEPVEFALDVTSILNTTLTASVTKFPVEGGGNISDHFQSNPLTLQITGMITQSPSAMLAGILDTVVGFTDLAKPKGISGSFAAALLTAGAKAALTGGFNKSQSENEYYGSPFATLLSGDYRKSAGQEDYPKQAMLGLIKMFEAGQAFRIRTYFSEEIYTNMVMTSLSFNQNAKVGNSLPFTITCQKVKVVPLFESTASELSVVDPVGSSAEETVDQGKKTKKEKEDDFGSFYYRIGKSIGLKD